MSENYLLQCTLDFDLGDIFISPLHLLEGKLVNYLLMSFIYHGYFDKIILYFDDKTHSLVIRHFNCRSYISWGAIPSEKIFAKFPEAY